MAKVRAGAGKTGRRKKGDRPADGMNDLERAYARHLDARKARGEIRDHAFQAIRLKIIEAVPASDGVKAIPASWYTPDFLVTELDWSWSIHETKGLFEDNSYGWLAFKAAASRHPFPAYFAAAAKKHQKDKVLHVDEWEIVRYGHVLEEES